MNANGIAHAASSTPWHADLAEARRAAQAVLASIDWSKRDIILNVPGTGDHKPHSEMVRVFGQLFDQSNATLVHVDYDTNWNFVHSIPQGIATLRLVLAGIAAHDGDHRVLLTGGSQGALIVGEAMREPAVRAMVTRAAIFGHPYLAATHYHDNADAKVREYDNPEDPVSAPVRGDVPGFLEAIGKLHDGDLLGALPTIAMDLAANVETAFRAGIWLARGAGIIPQHWIRDPHGYEGWFHEGFTFLRDGLAAPSAAADALLGVAFLTPEVRRRMIEAAAHEFPYPFVRGQRPG